MEEHKISMAEVEDKEQRKANEHSAGITYSTRRDPWVLRLSKVISKNYCCESFSRREKGKQTYKLYFCGLNEDVEILCSAISCCAFARADCASCSFGLLLNDKSFLIFSL